MTENASYESFTDVLRHRATHEPDRPAHVFLQDGEVESAALTYATLDRRARAIAAQLQAEGLAGERALLLFPPGLQFVEAFWGCLYAGVVAVPVRPPRPGQATAALQRVADDCGAKAALTIEAHVAGLAQAEARDAGLTRLRWIATDAVPDATADSWHTAALGHESLALLQYTSGSTGTPKGVMVSHGNLLHNSECLRTAFELSAESVSVTWLPSFHDMGLIDGVLQPVYSGFRGVIMPPAAFLQSPVRWLRAISRYGATHCGGPNFGYDLCVSKVTPEQRAELDLRTWTSAYNGAEPVHQATLERFAAYFEAAGFRGRSFYPCYGMAEATLMITGGLLHQEPTAFAADADALEENRVAPATDSALRSRHVVGCGRTWLGTRVEIVEPETGRPVAPGQVGEIWTAGPSVTQGYWQRPLETRETFGARLVEDDDGPFLRTGDLGFMKDGELYVTGRIKDMIIIRGLNYYPQDIEQSVQASYSGLRPSGGAAFAIEVKGEERLVVVQEVERTHLRRFDAAAATKAVRLAVAEEFGIQVYRVVFIRPATLPRTSSGKTQRQLCKRLFLEESLEPATAEERVA